MKNYSSKLIYIFIFFTAVLLLLPAFFGLYPALYTMDTAFYMNAFQHDSGLCSAPAVESILYRCLLYHSYLIDPSYALFSFEKILLTAGMVSYFSYVLNLFDKKLKYLALVPLLHPYCGLYLMLDERDVIFAILLALMFIQLLHLRILKFKNKKVLFFFLVTLATLPLIRDEGAVYSSLLLMYCLWSLQTRRVVVLAGMAIAIGFSFLSFKILHSNKLRYSLMSASLILANSEGGENDLEAIEAIQSGIKGRVKDAELNYNDPNAFIKARNISISNWELHTEKYDSWSFNRGALKLIMDNPILYLKIRYVFFVDTIYDNVFVLDRYLFNLERVAVYTHGKEFFESNLRPYLTEGEGFRIWSVIDQVISKLKDEHFVFALFTSALFGLIILVFCFVFFRKVEVAALATLCFFFESLITFFLAPESRGKYLFPILFAGLFVFIILLAEAFFLKRGKIKRSL